MCEVRLASSIDTFSVYIFQAVEKLVRGWGRGARL